MVQYLIDSLYSFTKIAMYCSTVTAAGVLTLLYFYQTNLIYAASIPAGSRTKGSVFL
jgi:hypothetical protein